MLVFPSLWRSMKVKSHSPAKAIGPLGFTMSTVIKTRRLRAVFPPFLEITRRTSQGGEILPRRPRAASAGRHCQECLQRLGNVEGRRLGVSRLPLGTGPEFRPCWGTAQKLPFLSAFCSPLTSSPGIQQGGPQGPTQGRHSPPSNAYS